MSLLVLFESSAGYALLEVVEAEEAGSMLPEVREEGKACTNDDIVMFYEGEKKELCSVHMRLFVRHLYCCIGLERSVLPSPLESRGGGIFMWLFRGICNPMVVVNGCRYMCVCLYPEIFICIMFHSFRVISVAVMRSVSFTICMLVRAT